MMASRVAAVPLAAEAEAAVAEAEAEDDEPRSAIGINKASSSAL